MYVCSQTMALATAYTKELKTSFQNQQGSQVLQSNVAPTHVQYQPSTSFQNSSQPAMSMEEFLALHPVTHQPLPAKPTQQTDVSYLPPAVGYIPENFLSKYAPLVAPKIPQSEDFTLPLKGISLEEFVKTTAVAPSKNKAHPLTKPVIQNFGGQLPNFTNTQEKHIKRRTKQIEDIIQKSTKEAEKTKDPLQNAFHRRRVAVYSAVKAGLALKYDELGQSSVERQHKIAVYGKQKEALEVARSAGGDSATLNPQIAGAEAALASLAMEEVNAKENLEQTMAEEEERLANQFQADAVLELQQLAQAAKDTPTKQNALALAQLITTHGMTLFSQTNSLVQAMVSLQSKADSLVQDIEKLKADKETQSNNLTSSLASSIQSKDAEISQKDAHIEAQQKQIEDLQQQLKTAQQSQQASAERAQQELKERITELEKQLSAAREQHIEQTKDASGQVQQLQHELAEARAQFDALNSTRQKLQADYDKMVAARSQQTKELEDAQKLLQESKHNVEQLQNLLGLLVSQQPDQGEAIRNIQQNIVDESQVVNEGQRQFRNQLQQLIKGALSQIDSVTQKEQQLLTLQDEVNQLRAGLQETETRAAAFANQITNLSTAAQNKAKLEETIAQTQNDLDKAKREVDTLRSDKKQLTDSLQTLQNINAQQDQDIQRLEQEVAEKVHSSKRLAEEHAQKVKETTDVIAEIVNNLPEAAKRQFSATPHKGSSLAETVRKLNSIQQGIKDDDIEKLNQKYAELQNTSKESISQLTKQIANLKSDAKLSAEEVKYYQTLLKEKEEQVLKLEQDTESLGKAYSRKVNIIQNQLNDALQEVAWDNTLLQCLNIEQVKSEHPQTVANRYLETITTHERESTLLSMIAYAKNNNLVQHDPKKGWQANGVISEDAKRQLMVMFYTTIDSQYSLLGTIHTDKEADLRNTANTMKMILCLDMMDDIVAKIAQALNTNSSKDRTTFSVDLAEGAFEEVFADFLDIHNIFMATIGADKKISSVYDDVLKQNTTLPAVILKTMDRFGISFAAEWRQYSNLAPPKKLVGVKVGSLSPQFLKACLHKIDAYLQVKLKSGASSHVNDGLADMVEVLKLAANKTL